MLSLPSEQGGGAYAPRQETSREVANKRHLGGGKSGQGRWQTEPKEVANNSATQSLYPFIQRSAPNGAGAAVECARPVNGRALNGTALYNEPLRRMPKYDRPFIANGNQGDIERKIESHLGDRGHERLEKYAMHSPEGFKRLITLFRRNEAAALGSEEFLAAQECSQ